MINYTLPTSLNIGGKDIDIRYDFRNILNCIVILNAKDLTEQEKMIALFCEFFVNPEEITDAEEAVEKMFGFISCGTEKYKTKKSYMNWEKDFDIIIPAINKVAGTDVRLLKDYHWWSFVGNFRELEECYFLHVVSIRKKLREGKKLEKWEQELYRDNREDIDLNYADDTSFDDLIAQSGWCS